MMETAAPVSNSIFISLPLTITGTMMGSDDELSVIIRSLYLSPLPTSLSDVVDSTSCTRCVLRCLVRPRLSCPVGSCGLEGDYGNFALEQHTDDIWPFFPQWLHVPIEEFFFPSLLTPENVRCVHSGSMDSLRLGFGLVYW